MMPIVGRFIDWLGLRLGFTLSIITWSIAQMITALATGWRSFAVFRALLGITEAGNFPGGCESSRPMVPAKGADSLPQGSSIWARGLAAP